MVLLKPLRAATGTECIQIQRQYEGNKVLHRVGANACAAANWQAGMRATIDQRQRLKAKHWLLAGALAVIALALTSNAVLDTVRLSLHDEETQYVLLSPFFIAWLVWARRFRLAYCRRGGGWVGAVMLALGWLAWSLGYRRSIPTLWFGGPVLMAAGAFVSVAGFDVMRKLSPAFFALAFVVPITPVRRQIIAAPMERYAAQWTQGACEELLGLHVDRHGSLLSVNGTEVEVAEACSGIRSIITFFLLCYVISFSQPWRWYVRALILLAIPVVAIVSNVARLVPTVWMYSHGAGETADRFHAMMGWIMLLLAFAVLSGIVALLRFVGVPVRRFDVALP